MLEFAVAGLPALRGGEPGQVRKEAATAAVASAGVRLATLAFGERGAATDKDTLSHPLSPGERGD